MVKELGMFWFSLFFSVIPILFYLYILWWLDKYEREPIKLVLIHFLWGMIGAIFLSGLFSTIFYRFILLKLLDPELSELFATIISAPLIEEAFKGIILIFTFRKINFDNLTDGIVYGGSIGLGFGMTENFLYFFFGTNSFSDLIYLAILRNLFSVSTHFLASATFGAFIAISKFRPIKSKITYILSGYIVSVGIHAIWNFTVSYSSTFLVGIFFIIISLIVMFALLQLSLYFERNILLYEMNDEIQNGYLSDKFASIIPNYKLRNLPGWIDEHFRKDYIKIATTLAFRKNQLKYIQKKELKETYENEIISLRNKLMQLEHESKIISNSK